MMVATNPTPVEVLLIEDNLADIRLTQECLKEAKVATRLTAIRDGTEALAYLRKQRGVTGPPRPDVILLDLGLPGMHGEALLREVKDDADLRKIPVVILTSSSSRADIEEAYGAFANCFITKPVDFDGFLKVVQSIEEFWFTVVKLPRAE